MMVSAGTLLEILRKEKEVFCELVNLSKTEQEYILKNDIEGLLDVSGKKEQFAFIVNELEQKRTLLIEGSSENWAHTTFQLKKLSDGFDPISSQEADELRSELLSVLAEFDHINQSNGELLKRNLDYVNFMLSTIIPDENPMYTNTAAFGGVSPRLIDGKA